MNDNMKLWDSVSTTDPAATKKFTRKGGFSGHAIKPIYLIKRATALWGPMGGKWGVRIVTEKVVDGAPLIHDTLGVVGCEKVHMVQIELIYPEGTVPAFGQTIMSGKDKNGFFTDEEAPKKSLTDALSKALSWLGFSSDIYEGKFDDVKYVEQTRREIEEEKRGEPGKTLKEQTLKVMEGAAAQGLAALRLAYTTLSAEAKEVCKSENNRLKAMAEAADAKKEGTHAAVTA